MTDVASDAARLAELTRELGDMRGRYEAVADVLRALSARVCGFSRSWT